MRRQRLTAMRGEFSENWRKVYDDSYSLKVFLLMTLLLAPAAIFVHAASTCLPVIIAATSGVLLFFGPVVVVSIRHRGSPPDTKLSTTERLSIQSSFLGGVMLIGAFSTRTFATIGFIFIVAGSAAVAVGVLVRPRPGMRRGSTLLSLGLAVITVTGLYFLTTSDWDLNSPGGVLALLGAGLLCGASFIVAIYAFADAQPPGPGKWNGRQTRPPAPNGPDR